HRLGVEEVADGDEPLRLLGDRPHHLGMAVADRGHRDPGQEVEVLVAILVPQPRALAAGEGHGVAGVGLEERHGAGWIFVPAPALVNSSSRMECGTRPSTMCAWV